MLVLEHNLKKWDENNQNKEFQKVLKKFNQAILMHF